jgi:prephenate dehydrogenase
MKKVRFKRITIIGVGLIGGSIGMALRRKMLATEVVGVCRRRISMQKAIKAEAIDKGTLELKSGVEGADLIIVATPVSRVKQKIKESLQYAKKGAIIIDVNSTKDGIMRFADKNITEGIHFVGTHPMAGLDRSGVMFADAHLFDNTACIITPDKNTDRYALKKIERLWKALGAKVIKMPSHIHDKTVARVSHLPHLLAYSLCLGLDKKQLAAAGTGFKDTTRIAKSDPTMWTDIFLENRKTLIGSIDVFKKELTSFRSYIKDAKRSKILNKLNAAKEKRESID